LPSKSSRPDFNQWRRHLTVSMTMTHTRYYQGAGLFPPDQACSHQSKRLCPLSAFRNKR
jgi:hypothetical protein